MVSLLRRRGLPGSVGVDFRFTPLDRRHTNLAPTAAAQQRCHLPSPSHYMAASCPCVGPPASYSDSGRRTTTIRHDATFGASAETPTVSCQANFQVCSSLALQHITASSKSIRATRSAAKRKAKLSQVRRRFCSAPLCEGATVVLYHRERKVPHVWAGTPKEKGLPNALVGSQQHAAKPCCSILHF